MIKSVLLEPHLHNLVGSKLPVVLHKVIDRLIVSNNFLDKFGNVFNSNLLFGFLWVLLWGFIQLWLLHLNLFNNLLNLDWSFNDLNLRLNRSLLGFDDNAHRLGNIQDLRVSD